MKSATLLAFALLVCHLDSSPIAAQTPQPSARQTTDEYADKLRSFEEFVRQQMEKNKVPGLTIGFIKDDYLWVKGFGYVDLENRVPAAAGSAYRYASVQKSMTAAAVLQL